MKGTNGIAVFNVYFLDSKNLNTNPVIAPIQTDKKKTAIPCAIPINAPTAIYISTSPKPSQRPRDINQSKRNGEETTSGASNVTGDPSAINLENKAINDKIKNP